MKLNDLYSFSPNLLKNINCKVKWFKAKRGYGFVVNEQIKEDIFIHSSVLLLFKKDLVLSPSSNIVCDINLNGHMQKPQVIAVHEVLGSKSEKMDLQECKGYIKWFNEIDDYGFVRVDNYDVFLPGKAIRENKINFYDLNPGTEVDISYFIDENEKKIVQDIKESNKQNVQSANF
ncbi:cold shock domain-containing protein [Candidatus Nesciobacter abundans]|uniref:CSD domain-containing protein n=1 Tax=Candidatus Nesciobacter abundans TaxID=2601668 RepID=A0A5C0UHS6_9PROT|nr:cold shock domain-containing protein [Candidatus Nesciobacter abundans]QEK39123.1 hypothetical protein FZC36_01585 [Candidatus Nesciobacter abundans]